MKKRLDKQEFAKLVLNIYANFLRMYHYDCFYDVVKIKALQEKRESKSFHLYFRRTGADFYLTLIQMLMNGIKLIQKIIH